MRSLRSATVVLAAGLLLAACGSAEQTSTPGIGGGGAETTAPASTVADDLASTTSAVSPTTVDGTVTTTTTAPTAEGSTPAATDPPTPATTAAPVATAAPPTPPVPAGPSGDTAAASTSKSWWFVGSEEGDPEATSDGVNCLDLYEAQGVGTLSYSRCGPWESFDGDYMWTVVKGASGRFQAIVWQQTPDPFTWVPKMKLVEPAVESGGVLADWDSVVMLTADIDSGPAVELLAGVTLAGTGGFLFFDVIDVRSGNPRPVATVHDLDRGRAAPDPSVGVAFYTPVDVDGEPNCCPSTWRHSLLTITSAGWAVVDVAASVPTASVPAGVF